MMMQFEHERLMREWGETIHHLELARQQDSVHYRSKIQILWAELEALRMCDAGPSRREPSNVGNDDDDGNDEDRVAS